MFSRRLFLCEEKIQTKRIRQGCLHGGSLCMHRCVVPWMRRRGKDLKLRLDARQSQIEVFISRNGRVLPRAIQTFQNHVLVRVKEERNDFSCPLLFCLLGWFCDPVKLKWKSRFVNEAWRLKANLENLARASWICLSDFVEHVRNINVCEIRTYKS